MDHIRRIVYQVGADSRLLQRQVGFTDQSFDVTKESKMAAVHTKSAGDGNQPGPEERREGAPKDLVPDRQQLAGSDPLSIPSLILAPHTRKEGSLTILLTERGERVVRSEDDHTPLTEVFCSIARLSERGLDNGQVFYGQVKDGFKLIVPDQSGLSFIVGETVPALYFDAGRREVFTIRDGQHLPIDMRTGRVLVTAVGTESNLDPDRDASRLRRQYRVAPEDETPRQESQAAEVSLYGKLGTVFLAAGTLAIGAVWKGMLFSGNEAGGAFAVVGGIVSISVAFTCYVGAFVVRSEMNQG